MGTPSNLPSSLGNLKRIDAFGYSILNESARNIATDVCTSIESGRARSLIFLNPHTVALASRDPSLSNAIAQSTDICCDGIGLAIATRLIARQRIHRVYGHEFFIALSEELSRKRIGKTLFIGSTNESLNALEKRYRTEFPGVPEVSSFSPPYRETFSSADIDEMKRTIVQSGAEVVWLGVGSPKQEKLLNRLYSVPSIRCIAAIGAVFDFYSGRVRAAPQCIRNVGMEWAYRLAQEPRRLWRRTFLSGPIFVQLIIHSLLDRRR